MLPSIEHFQERYANPKVYFLFYDYFFKAVMGESKWKKNLRENKRLGTSLAEAFTHTLIENNYFAWLFEYKAGKKNNITTLMTEYDMPPGDSTGNHSERPNRTSADDLFTPTDFLDIEIGVPRQDGQEFKCIAKATNSNRNSPEYVAARRLRKETQQQIGNDARSEEKGRKRAFDLLGETLKAYEEEMVDLTDRETLKKKRKCMRELKVYTGKALKVPNSDDSKTKCKGYSHKANKFMFEMSELIKEDVKTGNHRQFEQLYKKMIEVHRESENKENTAESRERYQVDCNTIYQEVEEVEAV